MAGGQGGIHEARGGKRRDKKRRGDRREMTTRELTREVLASNFKGQQTLIFSFVGGGELVRIPNIEEKKGKQPQKPVIPDQDALP